MGSSSWRTRRGDDCVKPCCEKDDHVYKAIWAAVVGELEEATRDECEGLL